MKKALCCLLVWSILLLGGCQRKTEEAQSDISIDYFDTVTTLTVYGVGESEFSEICDEIWEELALCHRLFDIYHSYDGIRNLCTVNEHAGDGEPIPVDFRVIELLTASVDMAERTEGLFSPTLGAVLRLWHEARERSDGSLPDDAELREAAAHTDLSCLLIDETASTVMLTDPAASLDVGAAAKGYAEKRACELLRARGVRKAILDLGGSVACVGGSFRVGVQDPRDGEEYLKILSLADLTAVTSGDYQRFFTVDGKRYHHIIDPRTLYPADFVSSVTVICGDPFLGDMLSTALFCMPPRDAAAFLEKNEYKAELLIVDGSGEIFSTMREGRTVK